MLSVWRETSHLYLAQGLALVRDSRGETVVLRHPPTLPLDPILERVAAALPQQARLKVTLSAALCPAVEFAIPAGIRNWRELEQIAQAATAIAMGLSVDEVQCEVESAGVAAGLPKMLLDDLQSWAKKSKFKIASIRPLWVVASECAAIRARDVCCLALQEPDAITVLAESAGGLSGVSLPQSPADGTTDTHIRRWLAGKGLTDGVVRRIAFSADAQTAVTAGMPKMWAPHWSNP